MTLFAYTSSQQSNKSTTSTAATKTVNASRIQDTEVSVATDAPQAVNGREPEVSQASTKISKPEDPSITMKAEKEVAKQSAATAVAAISGPTPAAPTVPSTPASPTAPSSTSSLSTSSVSNGNVLVPIFLILSQVALFLFQTLTKGTN